MADLNETNSRQSNGSVRVHIPTEPVGSLPRPEELIDAYEQCRRGQGDLSRLKALGLKAVEDSIRNFESTGSPVITDGEQTKSSFLIYPIDNLVSEYYTLSDDCAALAFDDGHKRVVPRLIKAPFKFGTFAHVYVDEAKKYTQLPIK